MTGSPDVHIHRTPPQQRSGVHDLYWKFATKRQASFEARLAGEQWPWSDDPILKIYKFCNVFRATDRVSQYMIRDVAYGYDASSDSLDRIFQIVAFRTFSKIETWRDLIVRLGEVPRLDHLRGGAFAHALDDIKLKNGGLYTGAFILCANKAFGFDEKHKNHVALFKHMFLEKNCAQQILEARSLQTVVAILQSFPLIGPFMAYQIAIDLNYADLINFSENDYTQAGPGALRGLKKAFVTLGDFSPADAILWMVERQDSEFARLDLPFGGLYGRKLHAIDCQGLFCELDKYCREAVPELASARSRIKAKYVSVGEDIDLFFPPKWELPNSGTVKSMGAAQVLLSSAAGHRASRERFAIADLFA